MGDINAVHVRDIDSCVTVTVPIKKGDVVSYHCARGIESVTANEDVPVYHKIAVKPVASGEFVYKYGEKIGRASSDIKPGDYVHIHNIKPAGYIEEV